MKKAAESASSKAKLKPVDDFRDFDPIKIKEPKKRTDEDDAWELLNQ